MPRRSSRVSTTPDDGKGSPVDDEGGGRPGKARRRSEGQSPQQAAAAEDGAEAVEVEDVVDFELHGQDSLLDYETLLHVKESDLALIKERLSDEVREELVGKLVRLLLLRASHKQAVSRADVTKLVLAEYPKMRGLTNHVLMEASEYLANVFGLNLVDGGEIHERYRGKYMLLNKLDEASHLQELHHPSARRGEAARHALLMATLALVLQAGRDGACVTYLVSELGDVDPNVGSLGRRISAEVGTGYQGLLEEWTASKYLLRAKKEVGGDSADWYSLGPRAFVEIGRKSILAFVYNVQGKTVDPTILAAMDREVEQEKGEDVEAE